MNNLNDRQTLLHHQYRHLFAAVAVGQWVELPADCRPVPGDHVKVVGVPHGHPYEGQIGIWNGYNRLVQFGPALHSMKFRVSEVRVIMRRMW
jgi:hypothetical protein